MPCTICGNNSYGNDVCPSCEEQMWLLEQLKEFDDAQYDYYIESMKAMEQSDDKDD